MIILDIPVSHTHRNFVVTKSNFRQNYGVLESEAIYQNTEQLDSVILKMEALWLSATLVTIC
jgi:hypothetical protein